MKQFKTSFRTLYKFRLYSIVNILGLAVSLACVIIIARYVHQEMTVNSFVDDLDRVYLMSSEDQNGQKRYIGLFDYNSDQKTEDLINRDAVQDFSRFIPYERDYIHYNEIQYNTKLIVTDNKFLKILPYPILYGSNFSKDPNEVILTKHLANKIFGKDNPVGQAITFSTGAILKVIGVIDDPSSKSFLEFDLLININLQKDWNIMSHNLIFLNPGSSCEQINDDLRASVETDLWNNSKFFRLVPLKDFYFDRSRRVYQEGDPVFIQGNIDNIRVLTMVAILILIVGLFNFINIYTVVSIKRGRELVIKKVYGASLWQIARQIWVENVIVVFISLIAAWFLLEITTVPIENILGFRTLPNFNFDIKLSIVVLTILPILVSIYPYVRYAKSASVHSLRAIEYKGKNTISRKTLLLLQYTISSVLLVISMLFMKQLNYMLNTKPGYNTENTIVTKMIVNNHLHRGGFEEQQNAYKMTTEKMALIRHKLDESPLITDWIIDESPIHILNNTIMFKNSDHSQYEEANIKFAPREYLDFLGFQLIEGRLWDSSDEFAQYKCIINESAKRHFNISDINKETLQPETRLWMSGGEDHTINPPYEIIGVIKDFNIGHLSKETPPLIIAFTESRSKGARVGRTMPLMAKFIPEKKDEVVAFLASIYKEANDDADFTYMLLDEEIEQLYNEDRRVSNVYTLFALLAIVISAMGLFALSLFDIQQRYREIALRKINGATAKDTMQLLLKKYLYLLAGAFVVAVPVSYFAISKYLEGFAHKASISWWLFAVAAVVVSAISLLTLVWQIKRAMKINPANALQSE